MAKNIFFVVLSCITAIVIVMTTYDLMPRLNKHFAQLSHKKNHLDESALNEEMLRLDLLDPQMAPQDIIDQVMYGYKIILHTNKILPKYVDDRLTCSNCHIAGGNTLGGKGGGISLVGVVKTYPRYSKRLEKTISLEERINNCFERSMNGKPLPKNSKEMKAILAYLKWIASEVPERKDYPWLGLKLLASTHIPDPSNGHKIYLKNCSLCHMRNGQGNAHNPPLWGPHAYNDGAGMSALPKLASFIFYNMPYNDPFLTQEQALDVAAFLVNQRRPKFIEKKDQKDERDKKDINH